MAINDNDDNRPANSSLSEKEYVIKTPKELLNPEEEINAFG